jgi:hypothetical protein
VGSPDEIAVQQHDRADRHFTRVAGAARFVERRRHRCVVVDHAGSRPQRVTRIYP